METRKSILITGASTGIGRASALLFEQHGFQVYAGVRKQADAESLKKASSGSLKTVILDVTQEDSIARAVKLIADETSGSLYGLMNNAGIPGGGALELLKMDAIRKVIDVDLISVFAMTQAFLPMLRKSRGRIVNTSSSMGISALPGRSAYAAAKFGVHAMSTSLRLELRQFGITVSVLSPGAIATAIWDKSKAHYASEVESADPELFRLYEPLVRFSAHLAETQKCLPSEAVAQEALHAFTARKPKSEYIIGNDAKFLKRIERLPEWLRDALIYKFTVEAGEKLIARGAAGKTS